jgi:hypothetical protein
VVRAQQRSPRRVTLCASETTVYTVVTDVKSPKGVAGAETNLRLILGWTGVALFYIGGILVVVVGAWSFGRAARREVRVAEAQGLVVVAGAVGVFGIGLSATSLDSAPLVPLGLVIIGLSLAIGAYGARLFRTRS